MDKKISQLDAASALQAADVAPFVQSGANVKATTQQIITAVTGATGTNGETVTTSKPRLDLTQTWDAVGTTFTALKFNVTDTASAAGSLLMDLQVGGVSATQVNKVGRITTNSLLCSFAGSIYRFLVTDGAGPRIASDAALEWTSTSNVQAGIRDLKIHRDAAHTLAQRDSTNAQTFRIYNTFTDASNYERGKIGWNSNVFEIGAETAGTGSSVREIKLVIANAGAIKAGTAANLADIFYAGTTTFSFSSAVRIGWADNSTNAGASPDTSISRSAAGVLRFAQGTNSDFNRLQFGGTTSSFPALKRSTTSLQARLADDSAFTNIQGKLTTETAYTAGAPTATGYIVLYDSTGTAYKVPAEAL
jgi:hypothetical protein